MFAASDKKLRPTRKTSPPTLWLGGSVYKPHRIGSVGRGLCHPKANTGLVFRTVGGFGFLGDTFFSLSLVYFSADLR